MFHLSHRIILTQSIYLRLITSYRTETVQSLRTCKLKHNWYQLKLEPTSRAGKYEEPAGAYLQARAEPARVHHYRQCIVWSSVAQRRARMHEKHIVKGASPPGRTR
jgi:hypothetical protein